MKKSLLMCFILLFSTGVYAEETSSNDKTVLEQVGVSTSIQEQVAVIIQKSIVAAEKTGEFLITEVPDVVKQFLQWKFWSAVAGAFIGFLILIGSGFAFKTWHVQSYTVSHKRDEGLLFFSLFAWIIGGFIGVFSVLINFFTALQIYIAPKVYLLEWAAQQVSRH